jgi:hypothetical protein
MTLAPHFLLTPRNFNGKQLITIDDRRQRRLMHRIKDPGRRSPQPEFWMRAFFFVNFLPLTFEKFRSSPKRNEGLKSCHDLIAV